MKGKFIKIMVVLAALTASIVVLADTGLITTGMIQTKANQDTVAGGAVLTAPDSRNTVDIHALIYRFDGPLTNAIINFYASDLGVDTLLYSKSNSTINASGRWIMTNTVNTSSVKVEVKTVQTNFPYQVHWGVIGK